MKFPNYGPGAQGALLQANALAADAGRPYALDRDRNQLISKLGEHLYVDLEDEEAPPEVSDAVGGVLRMVGHTGDGYATFKGNEEDAYAPTTDLYAQDGQTDPAATWPTFWRRGLSGPAAVWAQFARGFAQAYAAYIEREDIPWTNTPDIGDAVIVVPRPGQRPWVFCIKGQLGAGPVTYLQVQVVPTADFAGAPVPDAVFDLFGGVPFPPQASNWAAAPAVTALGVDAIRAAAGVSGSVWVRRAGLQAAAVGPYAVDGARADSVVVFQHTSTLDPVAAHLRVDFTANNSAALSATVSKIADGCPTGAVLGVLGVETSMGLATGVGGTPGGTGPGWTTNGEATCPVLVMNMAGALTTISMVRRRTIGGFGFAEYEVGMRAAGGVSAEAFYEMPRRSVVGNSHDTSVYRVRSTITGGPGAWNQSTEYFSSLDIRESSVTTSGAGAMGLLNFWGDDGGFYVAKATETGSLVLSSRIFQASLSTVISVDYASTLPPDPIANEDWFYSEEFSGGQSTITAVPPEWTGFSEGSVTPEWTVTRDDPAVQTGSIPPSGFEDVQLLVDDRAFALNMNHVFPHFGALPPTMTTLPNASNLLTLTSTMPRADAGQPVFYDVARSVVGGEQIVGRIAGLQDPGYSLAALEGTLVDTAEDRAFPNGPRVTFVGELQA